MELTTCIKWSNDFSRLGGYSVGIILNTICADVRSEATMDGKLQAEVYMSQLIYYPEGNGLKKPAGWYTIAPERRVNPKISRVLAYADKPAFPNGITPLLYESNEKNYGESGDKIVDIDARHEEDRIALAEERARNADPVRSAQFRKELEELFKTVK